VTGDAESGILNQERMGLAYAEHTIVPLEAELQYFEANRAELVRNHLGKFAVIKGDALIGAYDTAQAAYEAGVTKFGAHPFLMKQVLPTDPVAHAPALYTGLVTLA
jgi:hypothetical protein